MRLLALFLSVCLLAACAGPSTPSRAREFPTASVCGASPERCAIYRPRPGDDAWRTD